MSFCSQRNRIEARRAEPIAPHRPRLGGSVDRGRAERLEQAKMFSELSLLREDTVCRTPNLVVIKLKLYSNRALLPKPLRRDSAIFSGRHPSVGPREMPCRLGSDLFFCGPILFMKVQSAILDFKTSTPLEAARCEVSSRGSR